MCAHWLFCKEFNSKQLLLETFFHIICIFSSIEPWSQSILPFLYIIIIIHIWWRHRCRLCSVYTRNKRTWSFYSLWERSPVLIPCINRMQSVTIVEKATILHTHFGFIPIGSITLLYKDFSHYFWDNLCNIVLCFMIRIEKIDENNVGKHFFFFFFFNWEVKDFNYYI